jgi:hypothetical protein
MMICKYNLPFVERNKRREKNGLPPLSRRQFCKYAAASSAALGLVGLIGCEPDDSSGDGQAWGCGGPTGPGDGGSDYVQRSLGEDNRAEIEVRPGVELDDYSGPFRPDLRYTDFSKVGLSNLTQMANDYHNTIQNRYRQFVYDKHGHTGLVDSEAKIWGRNMVPGIKRMIKETMKISGWNLEAFMKQWQVDFNMIPSAHYDLVFEMPTRRRGIVTVNRCTVAEQYEAAGRTNELRDVCMARCGNYIQNAARKYNSNIIAKNLTMPPRPNENYVCCKWELYYRRDGSRCSEENDLPIDPDKMDKRGELAARPGVNLDDYCGPFRPDLRMTDFSREQLARMYLMYHQYSLNMIELYQVWEMGQVGFSESADMHVVVWSNDLAEAARSIMMKYLNTSGSGIDDFLKALQVDITAQPPNFDNDFEMPDENTGIYTFNKCFGMTMMEPIACEKQIIETCALDPPAIGNSCDMYSRGLAGKRIKLDIITMPPRTYTDEVCCQWKFSYVYD